MRIGAVVSNADDPTARVAIYVPNGYQIATAGSGTKLGDVTATAAAADLGGAILPLTGELDAVDPNALTPTQKAGSCAVPGRGDRVADVGPAPDRSRPDARHPDATSSPAPAAEATAGTRPSSRLPAAARRARRARPAARSSARSCSRPRSASLRSRSRSPRATTGGRRCSRRTTPARARPTPPARSRHRRSRHIPTQLKLNVTKKKLTTFRKVKGKRVKSVSTRVTFSSAATEAGKARHRSRRDPTTAAGKRVGGAKGSFIVRRQVGDATATAPCTRASAVPTGADRRTPISFYEDLGAAACVKSAIFGGLPCVAATVSRSTPKASVRVVGYTK